MCRASVHACVFALLRVRMRVSRMCRFDVCVGSCKSVSICENACVSACVRACVRVHPSGCPLYPNFHADANTYLQAEHLKMETLCHSYHHKEDREADAHLIPVCPCIYACTRSCVCGRACVCVSAHSHARQCICVCMPCTLIYTLASARACTPFHNSVELFHLRGHVQKRLSLIVDVLMRLLMCMSEHMCKCLCACIYSAHTCVPAALVATRQVPDYCRRFDSRAASSGRQSAAFTFACLRVHERAHIRVHAYN